MLLEVDHELAEPNLSFLGLNFGIQPVEIDTVLGPEFKREADNAILRKNGVAE